MLSQKHNIEWQNVKFEFIVGGKSSDGTQNLKLFLQDYAKLFKKNNLNPSCQNCIRKYHKEYIEKYKIMESKSNYILKKKYIGIPLKNNFSFRVNNSNITDKIGSQLLKSYGKDIFEKYPESKKTVKKETEKDEQKVVKKPKTVKK